MIEGEAAHRGLVVTGEVSQRILASNRVRIREAQGGTRGRTTRCEESDESIVVLKSRPEKAGNSLEEKTGTTRDLVHGSPCRPKAPWAAKGRSPFEGFWNLEALTDRTQAA